MYVKRGDVTCKIYVTKEQIPLQWSSHSCVNCMPYNGQSRPNTKHESEKYVNILFLELLKRLMTTTDANQKTAQDRYQNNQNQGQHARSRSVRRLNVKVGERVNSGWYVQKFFLNSVGPYPVIDLALETVTVD